MKDYIINNKKGILLVLAGFIMLDILVLGKIYNTNAALMIDTVGYETVISIVDAREKRVVSDEELVSNLLDSYDTTIEFMALTFQIDKNSLIDLLKCNYQELDLLNQSNFERFLIDYLCNLEQSNKELFGKTIVPCQDSKDYMLSLIKYFTNVYSEVDFSIAASIAQVESNFSAPGMLRCNNIFGGMSRGGLIRYKNIEYGVLKYIKLLADGYFNKGLVTIEDIGKVYNPVYNEMGVKIARPTWVVNVNKAIDNYGTYPDVNVNVLKNLKNY